MYWDSRMWRAIMKISNKSMSPKQYGQMLLKRRNR